jgi:hypothetical protein
MKRIIGLFCAMVVFDMYARTPEEVQATSYGADTKVVFLVRDDQGMVVSNALVKAGFYLNGKQGNSVRAYTGTNGILVAEKTSVGEINYWINKEGYYETSGRLNFVRNGVSNGRWRPYGMTNTVVLKRKVNPVAMCVRRRGDGILPPVKNEFLGFDLERGDWVAPHGAGKVVDLHIKYECEPGVPPQLYCRSVVTLSFTNRFDGAYRLEKEPFGAFPSVYRADTNAHYRQELRFAYDRLSGKPKEDTRLPESGYLVLRTRSVTDKDGNLVSAHYSKVYGPIEADVGGVYFSSYFNPNENDPNLEADTMKNLLNPNDLGFPP